MAHSTAYSLSTALTTIAALCVSSDAWSAGAAYAVDTAEISEVGSCKVESWVSLASNRDFVAALAPACVVSLFRPVEVSALFYRGRGDDEWTTGAVAKFKTNLIPGDIGKWSVAAVAGGSVDLVTKETTGAYAYIPATLRLSDTVRVNLNGGWVWDRILDRHYTYYGTGFDWRTRDNVWTLTGEVFGLAGAAESSTTRARFQAGLRFRPIDRWNIDVIYGRNLYGENGNWITLATVIRFPPPKN
jgi:hypothetical protein